jgi:hypothetical protein
MLSLFTELPRRRVLGNRVAGSKNSRKLEGTGVATGRRVIHLGEYRYRIRPSEPGYGDLDQGYPHPR